VQGVKDASVEQVAAVPGFGLTTARKVLQSLGVEVPALPPASSDAMPSETPDVPADTSPSTSSTP
jgi:hypothetical protein